MMRIVAGLFIVAYLLMFFAVMSAIVLLECSQSDTEVKP
jgi:hypothetical protein